MRFEKQLSQLQPKKKEANLQVWEKEIINVQKNEGRTLVVYEDKKNLESIAQGH